MSTRAVHAANDSLPKTAIPLGIIISVTLSCP